MSDPRELPHRMGSRSGSPCVRWLHLHSCIPDFQTDSQNELPTLSFPNLLPSSLPSPTGCKGQLPFQQLHVIIQLLSGMSQSSLVPSR